MATNYALHCVSKSAGADLSADQFKVVTMGAGEVVTLDTTAGGAASFGVLQNDPLLGEPAAIAIGGQTKIRLGATLADGVPFTISALGVAVAPVTGNKVLGTITEGGADGEIGSAVFNPANIVPA